MRSRHPMKAGYAVVPAALYLGSLGAGGCGGGSPPPPPPKDEGFCNIRAVPCLTYQLDSNGLPTACSAVACTNPADLSTCVTRLASAPNVGDRTCFKHADQTVAQSCASLCDPSSGHLDPINWPTLDNVRSLCTWTVNTDATAHPDLNSDGYVPNACMDPGPPTYPLGSAGTDAVYLTGTGTVTLDGKDATPVSINGGYFDMAAPKTSCDALDTTCPAQLNQALVFFGDFSLDGHDVHGMTLALDEQVLTASGTFSSGHFLFTIPQAINFDAVGTVDGSLTGLSVMSTTAVDGSIDLSTGKLAFQYDVTGSFDGKALEVNGLATTAQVIDVAPVVTAGPVTMVDSPTSCTANVTVTASATSAAGLPVTLHYVVDNQFLGTGPSVATNLPIGPTYDVTIVGFDSDGMRSSVTEAVTPQDTLGPVVTTIDSPITLWPPNHEYVTISLAECVTSVVDQCDGTLSSTTQGDITSVTSNELADAPGSGNTCNDIVIVDHSTVKVRAERQGGGQGRVYTINFTESDSHGNKTPASCTVQVPHDQSGRAVIDGPPVMCVGTSCGGIPGPTC